MHGAQFWGPALIVLGETVIFVALIIRYLRIKNQEKMDASLS
jgi:hypothetical protein